MLEVWKGRKWACEKHASGHSTPSANLVVRLTKSEDIFLALSYLDVNFVIVESHFLMLVVESASLSDVVGVQQE